jgi:trehalose 6-phosphate synthase/phosphatase
MQPRLIIVSNRLPVSVKKVDGKLEFFPSTGGLATGLAPYAKDKRNRWIGWPGLPSDGLSEKERQEISAELKKHNCYPVFLSQKQLSEFYDGYSNSILWPLLHDNPISDESQARREKLFKAYERVNAQYAETVLALSGSGTTIWVHDYQLMILPALLRLERPNDKIGFFLHTPFPTATNFAALVDAEALLAGVLGADLIGLHTASYVKNFLDTVHHFDSGITEHKKVILRDRVVRVTDFPIGIDYAKYEKARKSRGVTRELAKLRLQYAGLKVILTVDRLDPSKGLVERAKAYQTLLRENPKLRGKVVMIMLVVPSRMDVAEYQHLKVELEAVIKETNEEFGVMPWTPVDYLFTALPFEQVTALYRRADVAFITPLRDGMNLVAKEYLASKPNKNGVLVLSKTAGAADELKDAVMVDPRRPATLVKGLTKALNMKPKELRRRVGHMQDVLSTSTVQVWAGNFMHSLKQDTKLVPSRTWNLTPKKQRDVVEAYRRSKSRLLLLDYDGVLMAFHRNFADAQPTPKLSKLLTKLATDPKNNTVVISGRTKQDLELWFGDTPLQLVAEHGAYIRDPAGANWRTIPSEAVTGWQDKIHLVLEKYAALTPGAFVEVKQRSMVWHYRQATTYYAQKYLVVLKRVLKPMAASLGLQVQQGNMILEVRPDGVDKGTAAKHWLRKNPDFILAIGDDYTDEDTFAALPSYAFSVKVGRGRTAANYRLTNVEAVHTLLEKLSKS